MFTLDGDFMFASSRMSEQIDLDAGFTHASLFHAGQFCQGA